MDRDTWKKTQAPTTGPIRLPAAATPTYQLVIEAFLDVESPAAIWEQIPWLCLPAEAGGSY